MDAPRVAERINDIIQLASSVLEELHSLDFPSSRSIQCAIDITYLSPLLATLESYLHEEFLNGVSLPEVQDLAAINGPFDQYKSALEQLQSKSKSELATFMETIGSGITLEIHSNIVKILSTIERLKSRKQFELRMNRLGLPEAPKNDTTVIGEASVRNQFLQGPSRSYRDDLHIDSGTRRVTSNVIRKRFDSIESHAQIALLESGNEVTKRTEDSGSGIAAPAITMSRDSGYANISSNQPLKGGFNDLDTKQIASHEGYATVVSSLDPTETVSTVDVGNRRTIARVIGMFARDADPVPDRFNYDAFRHGPAAGFPTLPGEDQRNAKYVGGAAEQFAEILWNIAKIQRCVKLGFVVMDSDQFERDFLHLIKSFASELRAETNAILQTGDRAHFDKVDNIRIIRKTTAFDDIEKQIATKFAQESNGQKRNEQERNMTIYFGNEFSYLLNPDKFIKDFLISSAAFKDFKAQLEVFVESYSRLQQIMEDVPSQSHIGKLDEHVLTEHLKNPGFLRQAKNILQKSFRPAVPPGSKRVEWICECGDLLYMDFDSKSSRSSQTINALLCSLSATLTTKTREIKPKPAAASNGADKPAAATPATGSARKRGRPSNAELTQRAGSSHAPSGLLPRPISPPKKVLFKGRFFQDSTIQPGSPSNTPGPLIETGFTSTTKSTQSNHSFFELCVNSGKFLKSLGEISVSSTNAHGVNSIDTDGEFFRKVKDNYLRLRSFRARFWLLKPVNVSYVRAKQFSVEDCYRVGILHKPVALPPKTEVDAKNYHYDPCPLENELPISSDLFLHYVFSCSSPSSRRIWLRRIPRKLDLSIFASTTVAFGWGVHIDEGPDYLKVFILNLVIIGVSGVAALLWDVYRHDFQGAMGFAAWIIMLFNTLMAIFIAKWSQE
ncbi:hypothetical protein ACLOAV_006698 [Pseudogymnoascus australis]